MCYARLKDFLCEYLCFSKLPNTTFFKSINTILAKIRSFKLSEKTKRSQLEKGQMNT